MTNMIETEFGLRKSAELGLPPTFGQPTPGPHLPIGRSLKQIQQAVGYKTELLARLATPQPGEEQQA